MALETLKGIDKIDGFDVDHTGTGKEFISINHDVNSISFTIQNKPIKEAGVNGCQVDTIIETAKTILEGLNNNYPCRENAVAITKLDEALMWLEKRTKDREKRGVEGTMQA